MEHVIDVEGLTKHFGDVKAVNGIELQVMPGRIFGLIGPNGAGKTTINKTLTGQLKPTSGSVRVLGVDVVDAPVDVRKKLGIIPEQEAPPSFLTAEEYLSFIADVRKLKDVDGQIDFWFKLLDFSGNRNKLAKDLSRGNRQKLMVTQAFLHEPELVFIDEPLVNLDPLIQKRVKDYLRKYVKSGNTVFLSTHLLETAQELCDEIAIIDRGNIIAQGMLKDLLDEHESLEHLFIKLVGDHDAEDP